MSTEDELRSVRRELEYYKRQIDQVAGENVALDSALAGARHAVQRSRRAFALLSELQMSIAGLESLSAVLERIVTAINPVLAMDETIVLVPADDPNRFRPACWAGVRPEIAPIVAESVLPFPPEFASDEFILVTRAAPPTPLAASVRKAFDLPYFICLPVVLEQSVLALVVTGRLKQAGPFYPPLDGADVDTLRAVAALISSWVRTRRLADLERRMEADAARTRVAASIQLELLPKEPPAINGYDVAGRTLPAQMVGGDYFDFIKLDDRRYTFCLADVSGKGLPAALLMANLQATIRGQTMWNPSGCDCLARANKLFYRSTDASKFATLFYAVLNVQSHWLSYSNGGHNPALLLTPAGEVQWLESGGPVLGLFEDATFEEDAVVFPRGSILVVYSDGISEATNGEDEEFGVDRLVSCIVSHRVLPAAELIDAIVAAVHTHAAGALQSDDMTLLVIKR